MDDILDIDKLPYRGDIVYCRWPGNENHNDGRAYGRRVLVLDGWIAEKSDKSEYGVLRVCYGTDIDSSTRSANDFIFDDLSECKDCGLTKRTRFVTSPSYIKNFIWSSRFFVPEMYIANGDVLLGSVSKDRIKTIEDLLHSRGELKD